MKKHNLTKAVLAALLLASPLARADSEYPAANFEPVVISQDADLIAKHAAAAKERAAAVQAMQAKQASESSTASASVDQPNTGVVAPKAENPLAENFPIALIVLGLVGFIFWSNRKSGTTVQAAQPKVVAPVSGGATGETGVAKYLKNLSASAAPAVAETGVAKYLKNVAASVKPAVAETGVAKYLKKLEETAR